MRQPRSILPRYNYHVTARINRGEMIFEEKAYTKELFLIYVNKAKEKYSFSTKNISIMGNHIHMQIQPRNGSQLCNIMQSILGGFARKYNAIYKLKGHVWYDRYKSKIIFDYKQFFNTYLYIANNPVRANMVSSPLEYDYSGLSCFYPNNTYKINPRVKKMITDIVDPPGLKIIKEIQVYITPLSDTDKKSSFTIDNFDNQDKIREQT
jgi:putative transposase